MLRNPGQGVSELEIWNSHENALPSENMKVSDVDLILKNRSLSQLARSYTVGWRNWDFLGLGDVILLLGRTYLQVRKCLASFYITSYRFLFGSANKIYNCASWRTMFLYAPGLFLGQCRCCFWWLLFGSCGRTAGVRFACWVFGGDSGHSHVPRGRALAGQPQGLHFPAWFIRLSNGS